MEKKVFVLKPKPRMRNWWYLCYVVANQERKFRRELAHESIMNFSPVETYWTVQNHVRKKATRYLFGGYVFINKNHFDRFKRLNAKNPFCGLISIFNNSDSYSVVDDRIVYDLMDRQMKNEFDRTLIEPTNDICVGDKVFIKDSDNVVLWSDRFGFVLEVSRKNAVITMGNSTIKIPLGKLAKSGL